MKCRNSEETKELPLKRNTSKDIMTLVNMECDYVGICGIHRDNRDCCKMHNLYNPYR